MEKGQKNRFLTALVLVLLGGLMAAAWAQTDCADGNGVLDTAPPKNMTAQELIQKVAEIGRAHV